MISQSRPIRSQIQKFRAIFEIRDFDFFKIVRVHVT